MVEQQTCPYCGAETVGHTPPTGFTCNSTVFECNSYHYNPMNSWTKIYQSQSCMKRQIEQLQARIDELMFEHCPDEMTKEQIERYTNAQRIVEE
jgi:hypothetical protein